MPPDSNPVLVLRESLEAALALWHAEAELRGVPPERLTHYPQDIAFEDEPYVSAPPPDAGRRSEPQRAMGWVARAPGRAGRHYLVSVVHFDTVSMEFRALLAMAARLRSHLAPDEQADLVMLLVSPPGQDAPGRVSVLERNEAFAQVLVWTPGVDASKWPDESRGFVERLRLGPIDASSGAGGGDLSPVDAVFHGTTVGSDVRARWRDILLTTGMKDGERARLLLDVVDSTAEVTHVR